MMRNVKLLWGIIGCLLLLLTVLGWDYAGMIGSRKIATVGSVTLTEADWTRELKNKYGKLVLDRMIDREVIEGQAKKNGISVSEEELEREVNQLQDRFPNQKEFLEGMMSGETESAQQEMKDEIRYYLLLEKLATMDIHISEEEMFRYYEQNREKYNQPTLVRISTIYINTEVEAKQTMEELDKGADFGTLAKERSTDIYSAASGGDLGWVSLQSGDIEQAIIDQAMKMKEGQISSPVALEKGYAVIKLMKRKEAVVRSFADAKDDIRRELAIAQVGSFDKVLEQLRKNADIKFFQRN